MRESKPGILKYEWQDFDFKGLSGTIYMTKKTFEKNYGKFKAMIFPQGHNKPYCVWSTKFVVLFLNDDPLGIASVPRKPSEYMFG